MPSHDLTAASKPAELFRHVSAEKAVFYRRIMDVFAAAKRRYRLQLRPDEVLAEAQWPEAPPRIEEVNAALTQLADWGNLQSQPDMARVSTLSDFYRAKFLYRLSLGGEAVEAALAFFFQTLQHRAELQTVALEDIASRLIALQGLVDADTAGDGPDTAKVHEILRDLVRVFESLADNAQAFMAGVARSIELQQAEAGSVVIYKRRLIDYLDRFMGDLVRRSDAIARLVQSLTPRIDPALLRVAEREARDAAPGGEQDLADEKFRRWQAVEQRHHREPLRGSDLTCLSDHLRLIDSISDRLGPRSKEHDPVGEHKIRSSTGQHFNDCRRRQLDQETVIGNVAEQCATQNGSMPFHVELAFRPDGW